MLAQKRRKKGRANKMDVSSPGKRWLMKGCFEAQAQLDETRQEAMKSGIDVLVSYPTSSSNSCFMHVMFECDGRRILNFWPSCKRARDFAGVTDNSVESMEAALELAKSAVIRMVHGQPKPKSPERIVGPARGYAEKAHANPGVNRDTKNIRTLIQTANIVQKRLLESDSALDAELAAILGPALESVNAPF